MAAGSTRLRTRSLSLPRIDPRLLVGMLVVVVALLASVNPCCSSSWPGSR